MKADQPATPLWFRLSALGLGILLLFWLPIEDLDTRWVLTFAAAISALVAALYLSKFSASNHVLVEGGKPAMSGEQSRTAEKSWLIYALAGALAGLTVPPLATLLMIFKIGLHGHPNPDFSFGQVLEVFYRTPVFILAGLFVGTGIWLYRKTVR